MCISLKSEHKSLWETQDVRLQHLWELPRYNLKPATYAGQGGSRNKADHSKLIGNRLISKGNYLKGFSWAAPNWVVFCNCRPNLESLCRGPEFSHIPGGPNWLQLHTQFRLSHYHIVYLKAVSLEQFLVTEKARRTYNPRAGEGVGNLQLPESSLWFKLVVTSSW